MGHLINDPHLDKTCCCVGRGACVYLWCRLMILSNEHQHPHTWSPPGAPMLGNTQYRVASIMGRKIVSKIGGEQENRDPVSVWEINIGWMKLKLRQSDIDAIKLDRRPIIAQVERVGLFYLDQILLQHSLQLTAPGYLGVALVTHFEGPELSEEI